MKENGSIVFLDRELIVEVSEGSDSSNTVYRFKVGDGVTPYSQLPYVSSIYSLFPFVNIFDKNYSKGIEISCE